MYAMVNDASLERAQNLCALTFHVQRNVRFAVFEIDYI